MYPMTSLGTESVGPLDNFGEHETSNPSEETWCS